MGLGQAVVDGIARWMYRRSTYAASAPRIGSPWPSSFPVGPDWDSKKAIAEGYEASYIYYSVASDLADCQRIPPWGLFREGKPVDTHPLMEMVRRPNGQQTWGALLEAWDLDKSLAGNAYGHWEVIGDRVVVWRLRPDRMSVRPYKEGPFKGQIDKWLYSVSGDFTNPDEAYDPEKILHFMFVNPGDDYYGLAPLRAAARLVNTSSAGLSWHEHTIRRGARPDIIFSPKGEMRPDQHKKALKLLADQVQGDPNAHRPLIMSEPWEILIASMTPTDLDFLSIFDNYEDGVCKVLHVDPDAMGKTGATYQNKEWAIRDKWDGPVLSRAREMRAVMNLMFREEYDTADPKVAKPGDLSLDYDMSDTPGVQAARGVNLDRAPKLWVCGWPANILNERLDLGLGLIEGGDVGYVPANMLPGSTPLEGEGRSTRALGGELDLHYRAVDRRRQGWERGVAEKVKVLFAAERSAVVAAIKAGKTSEGATNAVVDGKRGAWETVFLAVYRGVIEDFGEQVAEELSPPRTRAGEYEFDPWTTEIKKYVTAKVAVEIDLVHTTTKAAIRRVVQAGLDDGLSMVQIAKNIRGVYDEWEEGIGTYRAMRIARTEVHNAAGYAMHESAKQSGVAKKKHWLDAGDDRVRDGHVTNTAAGWIGFDESYPDGALYPGDGTDDVNCRCTEMYKSR